LEVGIRNAEVGKIGKYLNLDEDCGMALRWALELSISRYAKTCRDRLFKIDRIHQF
jgi:hypothetical protein